MKFLIDMNLPPRWVAVLADAGFEAEHWSTLGPHNAPDSQIMLYAKMNGYAVITHDLDFSAILAANNGEKPSVVQIRADDITPEAIGNQLVAALRQMASELEQGALLTVDLNRARLRLLPFKSI